MENASKALIIAGAILISILIISFGVIILGQGSDVINNSNMDESEIRAFNQKYEAYEGNNVKGSNVIQLAKNVATNNRRDTTSGDGAGRKIGVLFKNQTTMVTTKPTDNLQSSNDLIVKQDGNDGGQMTNIQSGGTYKVKCFYASNGLVDCIVVTK